MKTKNLVLGLAALLMAAGTALASLAQVTPYMDVTKSGVRDCLVASTTAKCEDTGAEPCKITINGNAYQAYRSGCTQLLKNTSSASIVTITDATITQVFNPPL